MNEISLYVHIPFCMRKCGYCDFLSVGIGNENSRTRDQSCLVDDFTDALIDEFEREYNEKILNKGMSRISTIFLGGGTPSILDYKNIDKLLKTVSENLIEWTIECNPGTVDEDKLKLCREYGVNRISFGLQSANEDELKCLGRIHTYKDFLDSYELARNVGFNNINIDLMSAIPGQTYESYRHTLEEVISLRPEHISAYSLIIEDGTPFYDQYKDNPPVSEKLDRQMFEMTHQMLTDVGYIHYEVSNYALPGYECKHNLNYWKRGEYIGIGPSAASHIGGVRTTNTSDINEYISKIKAVKSPVTEKEKLTKEQQLIEEIYLGLRTIQGINLIQLSDTYKKDLNTIWSSDINQFIRSGLVNYRDNQLTLTIDGMWVSDSIINILLEKI